MKKMIITLTKIHSWLMVSCLSFIIVSCNTEYPNLLRDEYGSETFENATLKSKKVLYLIVSGVNGDVLKTISPANMTEYSINASYSYEMITDINAYTSNANTGLTTLLTGRNPEYHGVVDVNENPDLEQTPDVFSVLRNKQTSLFTSSSSFYDTFGQEASVKQHFATDEELNTAVLGQLATSTSDLVLVHYTAADEAGAAGGYDLNNSDYVEAIQEFDSYLKELIEAINNRENISKEEWLVVVTSDRGGQYGQPSSTSNHFLIKEKNNFVIFYNPKFVSRYYARPGTEIPFDRGTLRFTMNPVSNTTKAVMADATQFNMQFPEANTGYTIQFKIKYSGNGGSSWPEIISKATNADNPSGGFVLFSSSATGGYQYRVGTSSATSVGTPLLADNTWRTFTIVFVRETSAASIKTKTYIDGAKLSESTHAVTQLSNNQPLTVGRIRSSGVNGSPLMNISQLFIANRAMADIEVSNSYCKTEIDENHPVKDDLIGLWRFDEMTGTSIPNQIDKDNIGQRFLLSGQQNWEQVNEYAPTLCPPVLDSYYLSSVPTSADIPLTIVQWLGADFSAYKDFDGTTRSFTYTNLQAQ